MVGIRQKEEISGRNRWQTLTWASFTSPGRFETIIFSDPCVTAFAVSVAGVAAARERWIGVTAGFPRTWARAEERRPAPRRALGLEEMIYEIFSDKGLAVTSWKDVLRQEICPLWIIRNLYLFWSRRGKGWLWWEEERGACAELEWPCRSWKITHTPLLSILFNIVISDKNVSWWRSWRSWMAWRWQRRIQWHKQFTTNGTVICWYTKFVERGLCSVSRVLMDNPFLPNRLIVWLHSHCVYQYWQNLRVTNSA